MGLIIDSINAISASVSPYYPSPGLTFNSPLLGTNLPTMINNLDVHVYLPLLLSLLI